MFLKLWLHMSIVILLVVHFTSFSWIFKDGQFQTRGFSCM